MSESLDPRENISVLPFSRSWHKLCILSDLDVRLKTFLTEFDMSPFTKRVLNTFCWKIDFWLDPAGTLFLIVWRKTREEQSVTIFVSKAEKTSEKNINLAWIVVVTKTWFFIFWESSCFDKILYIHTILSRIFCFLLLKFKKWRTKNAKLNTIKSLDRLWTFGKASFKYNTSPKKLYGRVQFDCKFSYLF